MSRWFARWGNWSVGLRQADDTWNVTVWRWLPGKPLACRHELDACDGFKTRTAAIEWAAAVMKRDGARIMVLDAPGITIASTLAFDPAPEPVA